MDSSHYILGADELSYPRLRDFSTSYLQQKMKYNFFTINLRFRGISIFYKLQFLSIKRHIKFGILNVE